MEKQLETEILIIGAGSTGLAIARELSKYEVDVTVVEKNVDVSFGEGGRGGMGLVFSSYGLANANSLILKSTMTPDLPPSEFFHPDALKTRLTLEGFHSFPTVAEELDVPFEMFRELVLGREDEGDLKSLKMLEEICDSMGIEIEPLDQETIQELSPHVNKDFTRGFTQYGDQGHIYTWDYTIALAENARDNGVRIMLLTEVRGITPIPSGFVVDTKNGLIKARFIVNAAGAYADKIAEMAGVRDFDLTFMRVQFHITDKCLSGLANNHFTAIVFRPGVAECIVPTLSGGIQIACSGFHPGKSFEDNATWIDRINRDLAVAQGIFPEISRKDIINSYVAVAPFNTRDPENHLLEVSKGNPNFINAVVRMPGTGFAPAMAKYVVELLVNQGLKLTRKADFHPRRKRIPKVSELPDEERRKLIAQDPRYGHIVCRCEEVSEGEIVEAIRRGARTVTGVKYRTRAGMGRCQRGFCGPRVVEILARELDIPMPEVTYKGGLSRVLHYRSKELLGS